METMLVNGTEHAIQVYDDDCGFGLTLCNHTIGPQDIGPRLDEKLTCELCKEIIAKTVTR